MLEEAKKAYHHGDLRSSLLAAAEQALEELPLEKISLREIARRAGVSHAAPKHHFGSLGALLGDVTAVGFERFASALGESADRASDQSPEGRLRAMGRGYQRFAQENRAAYGLMFGQKSGVERTPRAAKASMAAWEQLESAVAAITGSRNAVHGAMLVWSSCHGYAMLDADREIPPQVDRFSAMEAIIGLCVAGLKASAE
jgi:AcrR family transcriptional regulator